MSSELKPIPSNINRQHVLSAIKQIDREGVLGGHNLRTYALHYEKKIYPPKYVIMLANKWANGEEFPTKHFYSIDAAKHLKALGFTVLHKTK